tara:strand:+ start:1637 stop:2128 length:492 start_codon:yes stop_codon:yes gene_type:complete
MTIFLKNKHTLKINDFNFYCSIGKRGLTKKKSEGDKKTPIGTFRVSSLYFREDRLEIPQTKLKKIPIKKTMGWCDDIRSSKYYNKLMTIQDNIRHEKLFRKDDKYDLLIPIEYNSKRIIGNGSCIFMHLTKNYKPTAGCIALKKNDFLVMLKIIGKKTKIKIY